MVAVTKSSDNLPCATQKGRSILPGSADKPAGRKVTTRNGKRDPSRWLLKLVTEHWKP